EAELSVAWLHQLMLPVADTLAELPDPHRTALSTALGLGVGDPPSRLVLVSGLLAWLRRLTERAPVVVLFDDIQWTDRASASLLSLAARRLDGLRVAMVFAERSGYPSFLDRDHLPSRELEPLSDSDAHE